MAGAALLWIWLNMVTGGSKNVADEWMLAGPDDAFK
jgi:hypothetical protein